jgi:hypothetical protein
MDKRINKTNISSKDLENQIFPLENSRSEVINKISMSSRKDDPKELDREYMKY